MVYLYNEISLSTSKKQTADMCNNIDKYPWCYAE